MNVGHGNVTMLIQYTIVFLLASCAECLKGTRSNPKSTPRLNFGNPKYTTDFRVWISIIQHSEVSSQVWTTVALSNLNSYLWILPTMFAIFILFKTAEHDRLDHHGEILEFCHNCMW